MSVNAPSSPAQSAAIASFLDWRAWRERIAAWREDTATRREIRRANRALLREFAEMPDWLLTDIGLTREDIDRAYREGTGPFRRTAATPAR
jgi:uncharacterized protein YjiS (DUF1127 family)